MKNISFIKESTQDITSVQKTVFLGGNKITAFAALDHLIMPLLGVGCKGIMAASVSIVPEQVVSMWKYFEKGYIKKASEILYSPPPL
jgi:dihydrodipicolinate synthase/N-acetylneuraminate lyase